MCRKKYSINKRSYWCTSCTKKKVKRQYSGMSGLPNYRCLNCNKTWQTKNDFINEENRLIRYKIKMESV